MKPISLLVLAAVAAGAHAQVFDVFAAANSSAGGVGASTVALVAGQSFTVTSSTNDLWTLGPLPRWSDADGLVAPRFATALDDSGQAIGTQIGANFGLLTVGSFSAPFGAMVGRIGAGPFFLVGTNYSGVAAASGTLQLFNWDSNTGDNAGKITVRVNAEPVPEPATLALAGAGLAAAVRRRRARRA